MVLGIVGRFLSRYRTSQGDRFVSCVGSLKVQGGRDVGSCGGRDVDSCGYDVGLLRIAVSMGAVSTVRWGISEDGSFLWWGFKQGDKSVG